MRRDSARVARYLATASAAAAGAAAGSAEAGVVTSASVGWTGWSNSITAVTNVAHTNNNWGVTGDPINTRFSKLIGSIASVATGTRRWRAAKIKCAGVSINPNRLNTGAVIGAGIAGGFGQYGWLAGSYGNPNNGVAFSDSNAAAFGWLAAGTGADSQTGYIGFRLVQTGSSDYYYGYFKVTVSRTSGLFSTLSLSITGWAYESTINTGITIPAPSAVPGGAGLAALACGAAGLRGRRRVA